MAATGEEGGAYSEKGGVSGGLRWGDGRDGRDGEGGLEMRTAIIGLGLVAMMSAKPGSWVVMPTYL